MKVLTIMATSPGEFINVLNSLANQDSSLHMYTYGTEENLKYITQYAKVSAIFQFSANARNITRKIVHMNRLLRTIRMHKFDSVLIITKPWDENMIWKSEIIAFFSGAGEKQVLFTDGRRCPLTLSYFSRKLGFLFSAFMLLVLFGIVFLPYLFIAIFGIIIVDSTIILRKHFGGWFKYHSHAKGLKGAIIQTIRWLSR